MKALKKIAAKMDEIFCLYLGLDRSSVKPEEIKVISDTLIIKNTESNKRHVHTIFFDDMDLSQYSSDDKERLGIAVGKSIATNLVIKFSD